MRSSSDFDEFYRACAPRLTVQVYALTGDWAEAQDCVQEAFVRAWQRWERLTRYDEPAAWVRTVAIREAISRWRRGRRGAKALLGLDAPVGSPAPSPDAVDLARALDVLPHPQRIAVVLHYLCGASIGEIAELTSAPTGTVKARLSRARTTLGALLTEHDRSVPEANHA